MGRPKAQGSGVILYPLPSFFASCEAEIPSVADSTFSSETIEQDVASYKTYDNDQDNDSRSFHERHDEVRHEQQVQHAISSDSARLSI